MKYKITLLTILVISISLSAFGAWVDNDPSNTNLMTNVFELVMMTLLVFAILTTFYFATKYSFKKVKLLAS